MSNLLILIIIGIIFYLLNKDYDSNNFNNIQSNQKQSFNGNLKNHEAGILVALMAKVAKADGHICELEAELLSHTFTDISNHFENSQKIREELKIIYQNEKNSFENTIELAKKYLNLTKYDYTKRLKLIEYLLNLAFIDNDFSQGEFLIIEDISNALEIKHNDFINLINSFKQFYSQKENSTKISLENAYKLLGVNQGDDLTTIKKAYRKLVKQYHPDIVAGSGADRSIIEEATKKLQEINEAYELIKKSL